MLANISVLKCFALNYIFMGTHYDGTEAEKTALDLYIKLWRAADAVAERVNEHLKDANLTVSQFGVLEALYHLGPLQPSQLAQKVLKSSGNMTLVIDQLVERQLVRRKRRMDDRRCIDVELTPAGEAQVEAILPEHVAGIVETVDVLSLAEQRHLAKLCRKLGRAQMQLSVQH